MKLYYSVWRRIGSQSVTSDVRVTHPLRSFKTNEDWHLMWWTELDEEGIEAIRDEKIYIDPLPLEFGPPRPKRPSKHAVVNDICRRLNLTGDAARANKFTKLDIQALLDIIGKLEGST